MKTSINLNDYVSFTLTQRGADIINSHNEYRSQKVKGRYCGYKTDYKEGDEYKNQFHTVIQIFGEEGTKLGYEAFCKECMIYIETK